MNRPAPGGGPNIFHILSPLLARCSSRATQRQSTRSTGRSASTAPDDGSSNNPQLLTHRPDLLSSKRPQRRRRFSQFSQSNRRRREGRNQEPFQNKCGSSPITGINQEPFQNKCGSSPITTISFKRTGRGVEVGYVKPHLPGWGAKLAYLAG